MAIEYGGIFTYDGTAETTGQGGIDDSHWEKVTGFLYQSPANGISINADIDELQILNDGVYFVFFGASFSGSARTLYQFEILKNEESVGLQTSRDIFKITDVVSCSMGGPIIYRAGDRIMVGVKADAGGKEITIKSAQLTAMKTGFI